jgi:hypothetical protein
MGWESIEDFRGAKLRGQTNVRVFPGSLEYLSKQSIMNKVQFYAQMGWVTGQQAMEAIERGQTDTLTQGYDEDKARINRIIQRIRDGTLMDMPTRPQKVPAIDPATGGPAIDPATGQPAMVDVEVPTWMPDEYDNVPVWKENLSLWLKSDDFERSSRRRRSRAGSCGRRSATSSSSTPSSRRRSSRWRWRRASGWATRGKPQGAPALPSQPNITADQGRPQAQPAAAPDRRRLAVSGVHPRCGSDYSSVRVGSSARNALRQRAMSCSRRSIANSSTNFKVSDTPPSGPEEISGHPATAAPHNNKEIA